MKNLAYKTSFFYYAILPYLGYVVVLSAGGDYPANGLIIMLGWLILLVHQTIYLAVFEATAKRTYPMALPFIPPLLIAINQATLETSLGNFFLEQTLMEVVGLMIGISIAFLFFKNDEGRTAWQDLGILPFIVVGIIGAGSWGFIATWWKLQVYTTEAAYWHIMSFAVAFIVEIRANLIVLNKVVKREIFLNEVFSGDKGLPLILGQILLWFLLAPLVYWLT